MPISKQWPSGGTNPVVTSYNIPLNNELNWTQLSSFLQALADSAQGTSFQKFAARVGVTSPIAVSATTDCVVVSNLTVAGPVAVTLPAGAAKQIFIIVDGKGDAGTNNITITPNGAETIKGAATLVLSSNYTGVVLVFTGTNWDCFGPFLAPGQVTPADFVGILPTTKGGTGVNSTATFPSSGTVAVVPAAGVVKSNGTVLSVSNVDLTTEVTGVLPVANGGTGISSLGAGVATWLGTPSSANLASAVTDETGTGSLVFANTPTLVAPLLGTPTSGVLTNATGLPIDGGTVNTLPITRGGTGQTTKTPAFDALSPNTTKGDLVGHDGTNSVRVPIGSNGSVLTADSTQTAGINWTTPLTNPMTTQGDIIYGDTGGAAVRLGAGTSGQVLRTNGVAAPTWSSVGLLPLGSVIATFPNLGGAYVTVATTTPDTNGFVLCQGQTLVSGAMSGAIVPNINNSIFLRGSTTAGGTGGAATRTLAANNIPTLTLSGTNSSSSISGTAAAQSWSGSVSGSNSASTVTINKNQWNSDQIAHDHNYVRNNGGNAAGGGAVTSSDNAFQNTTTGTAQWNSANATGSAAGQSWSGSVSGSNSASSISGTAAAQAWSGTYTNGSLTSFGIEPTYINAVYLMRVN